jgi:hypothetical protein
MDNAATPAWLESLRNRLTEVLSPESGADGRMKLLETLAALADLLARHRAEMPNDLVHYLERRSYEKAARFCDEGFSSPQQGRGPRHY